jgi:hypothetical protein
MSWPSCMHALLTSIGTSTTTPADAGIAVGAVGL